AHSAGFTHRLDLVEVATGFGASLVEVLQRSAGQLELAGGFQADGAIVAAHRDDLPAFLDRLPAELAQLHQNVTDTARLVIARSPMIVALVDQLLMLGADPPAFRRLLAGLDRRDELLAPFDTFFFPARPRARAHAGAVRRAATPAPAQSARSPLPIPSHRHPQRSGSDRRCLSPQDARTEVDGSRLGKCPHSCALGIVEPAFRPDQQGGCPLDRGES